MQSETKTNHLGTVLVVMGIGLAAAAWQMLDARHLAMLTSIGAIAFAFVLVICTDYSVALTNFVLNNTLRASEQRRMNEIFKHKRRHVAWLIAFSMARVLAMCVPWFTLAAFGEVYQWSILLAGFAFGQMINSIVLLRRWAAEISDMKVYLKDRDDRVGTGYSRNMG